VVALARPGPTALVLVLIVGVWAVIAGLVEFLAAFASGEPAGTRAMLILGGLATIAFGVVLCARPGLGAVTLALLFGLFNLIAGTWMLVQGIELRRTGKTLHPAHSPTRKRTRPEPCPCHKWSSPACPSTSRTGPPRSTSAPRCRHYRDAGATLRCCAAAVLRVRISEVATAPEALMQRPRPCDPPLQVVHLAIPVVQLAWRGA